MKKMSGIIVSLLVLGACQSPGEKIESEQRKGRERISDAEKNVDKAKAETSQSIAETYGEKKEEKKLEATKEIANAEEKVDEEKIRATEKITEAEKDAGLGGTYKRE